MGPVEGPGRITTPIGLLLAGLMVAGDCDPQTGHQPDVQAVSSAAVLGESDDEPTALELWMEEADLDGGAPDGPPKLSP